MDEFVLDNAKSVMQLARPNYAGVSAKAVITKAVSWKGGGGFRSRRVQQSPHPPLSLPLHLRGNWAQVMFGDGIGAVGNWREEEEGFLDVGGAWQARPGR